MNIEYRGKEHLLNSIKCDLKAFGVRPEVAQYILRSYALEKIRKAIRVYADMRQFLTRPNEQVLDILDGKPVSVDKPRPIINNRAIQMTSEEIETHKLINRTSNYSKSTLEFGKKHLEEIKAHLAKVIHTRR